jgi:hypothetical protein
MRERRDPDLDAIDAVVGDGEPRGHRIKAIPSVGPNDLIEGPVGGGEQVARQRNGGSEDAVCGFLAFPVHQLM